MSKIGLDVAFSNTTKQIQARKGSRTSYERLAKLYEKRNALSEDLVEFIQKRNSFYIGTSSADGQPYIQHRGGPPGFIHVINNQTLAFADFKGNRQFISQGNLSDNPKAFIFLMDYWTPRRLKLWGEARVEEDPELMQSLMPQNYSAMGEQVIIFDIKLWDLNCDQHIPALIPEKLVQAELAQRDQRIVELESELNRLKETTSPG